MRKGTSTRARATPKAGRRIVERTGQPGKPPVLDEPIAAASQIDLSGSGLGGPELSGGNEVKKR